MTFFLEIYLHDLSLCFFSTTFNHPIITGFKEHFEIQQIIPNWNVQPWSYTLSGWCFVSSYWFFYIRISTFAFLTHIFKSPLLFAKDTAISLVPQAHVNGITVQSYLPLDLMSNSSPNISRCLTLFEAFYYLISVLLRWPSFSRFPLISVLKQAVHTTRTRLSAFLLTPLSLQESVLPKVCYNKSKLQDPAFTVLYQLFFCIFYISQKKNLFASPTKSLLCTNFHI